jgi:DNA-binding transcriptional MerR regulator
MTLKMKELIAQSGENKSTILYYLKEGLLPEPSKPKPNVHLYHESSVEIIKFIKYLQQHFSYTIAEIKRIFEQTPLDLDGSFEMMVSALEIATVGRNTQWYTKEAFLETSGLDEATLESYIVQGYVFERMQGFSTAELEIVEILHRLEQLGLERALIDQYVQSARTIAKLESEAGARMFARTTKESAAHYELLFDMVLKLKPYIYNMHTVSQYHTDKRKHS